MAYGNPTSTTRDTIEKAGDTASDMAQKAGDAAKNVSKDMSDALGNAAGMAQDQLDSMTTYIRKNPLQATAIAAGVGFMFALIARR